MIASAGNERVVACGTARRAGSCARTVRCDRSPTTRRASPRWRRRRRSDREAGAPGRSAGDPRHLQLVRPALQRHVRRRADQHRPGVDLVRSVRRDRPAPSRGGGGRRRPRVRVRGERPVPRASRVPRDGRAHHVHRRGPHRPRPRNPHVRPTAVRAGRRAGPHHARRDRPSQRRLDRAAPSLRVRADRRVRRVRREARTATQLAVDAAPPLVRTGRPARRGA